MKNKSDRQAIVEEAISLSEQQGHVMSKFYWPNDYKAYSSCIYCDAWIQIHFNFYDEDEVSAKLIGSTMVIMCLGDTNVIQ